MVGRKRALRLLTVDLLLLHAAHRGWKGSAQPAQDPGRQARSDGLEHTTVHCQLCRCYQPVALHPTPLPKGYAKRSEEHTSELQSLMRISYAVFCLQKKTKVLIIQTKIVTQIYRSQRNIHYI